MNKLISTILLTILLITANYSFSQTGASDNYKAYLITAPSSCTQKALDNIIDAVNSYRADSKKWQTILQPEFTLRGAEADVKGQISIPVSSILMKSAKETAGKIANGTYPQTLEHFINGEGATMRAIKDGWIPSMNKLFTADVIPPFTMIQENLYMGTSGKYFWNDVVNGWISSPGHNTTLLSSGSVSIGCGCSDSPVTSDGTKNTYWVLLIESEATITEHDDVINKYFNEGTLYQVKKGMENKDFSNYKAYEFFELIDGALSKIK